MLAKYNEIPPMMHSPPKKRNESIGQVEVLLHFSFHLSDKFSSVTRKNIGFQFSFIYNKLEQLYAPPVLVIRSQYNTVKCKMDILMSIILSIFFFRKQKISRREQEVCFARAIFGASCDWSTRCPGPVVTSVRQRMDQVR